MELVAVGGQFGFVFLKQVGNPGGLDREGGGEGDGAAFALGFVEAEDEAVAVFGAFEGFEDEMGGGEGDEGGGIGYWVLVIRNW